MKNSARPFRRNLTARLAFVVLALVLSMASSVSGQVTQPTGCPRGDTGSVCLGSGGSSVDTVIVVDGVAYMRVSRAGAVTFPNSAIVTLPSGATFINPTITVNSGSFSLGLPSQASGDLLYADAATTYTRLAKPATTGMFLRYTGTLPGWSTLVLPNAATAGDLIAATATNTVGSVADVAVNQVLVSGGVGVVPAYSATPVLTSVTARYVANGSAPSVANVGANSCGTSAATVAGNDNTGIVTVGATSGTQCRVTFTAAAPTRWQCIVNNETTANLARTTSVSVTQMDFLGTFVGADVLSYVCAPR